MSLFFLKGTERPPARGRSRRRGVPHRGRGHARARQASSSPSAARAATRARSRGRRRRSTVRRLRRARATSSCWNKYWAWTKTAEFKHEDDGRSSMPPDFLKDNYLSTDLRVPVTLLETNACSPLATNALRGDIWDNFSSTVLQGAAFGREDQGAPARTPGRSASSRCPPAAAGYTRAALPHQRVVDGAVPREQQPRPLRPVAVGRGADGIVRGLDRAAALAGEAREGPPARRQGAGHDRPHHGDELDARAGRLSPRPAAAALRSGAARLPEARRRERHRDRADPRGHADQPARRTWACCRRGTRARASGRSTPRRWWRSWSRSRRTCSRCRGTRRTSRPGPRSSDLVEPLLRFSSCPDFVVNRGHYFGTGRFKEEPGLSDADKRALIEFMKTF